MTEFYPVISLHDDTIVASIYEELQYMARALEQRYETPYGALYSVLDEEPIIQVTDLVKKLKNFEPSLMVLVGIGGSNMGTLAVLRALGKKSACEFLGADTIDEQYTRSLLARFRATLSQGKKALVCIVTKSGTTPETVINGALFLEILKEFYPNDYHQYVVAITDIGSPLDLAAQKEGYSKLPIPKEVGGRYSLFTTVGLFPLMMLGIDVKGLRKGAARALRAALLPQSTNQTVQHVRALYLHYRAGYRVYDFFVFSPSLLLLGHWGKQLMGESLGKEYAVDGTRVEVGLTPLVSLGTTDLHSVAQLYLAGPRIQFTNFLFFEDESSELTIPVNELSALVPGIATHTLTQVKSAMVQGTIAAYKKQGRPFLAQSLEHTAESIGGWMIQNMVSTILLGRLFNINPFDQPAVELYKQETRMILKG